MTYYSKTTTENLKVFVARSEASLAEPMPSFFADAYAYDGWRNQRQDEKRHLVMMREELAVRSA